MEMIILTLQGLRVVDGDGLTLKGLRVVDGDDQINLTRVKGVCGCWLGMIRLTLQGLHSLKNIFNCCEMIVATNNS